MLTIDSLYSHFLKHKLVSTDSRKIDLNCIFFALKGDNFNGNLFAENALKKGAAYAIVDEEIDSKNSQILIVEDVLKCLQDFATRYRREFDIPIIAITGSNGKTTTKELLASVLSTSFNTHYTKGNFNNHIGVPLTLLQLNSAHRIAIIEMGANHIGEIDALCRIAEPTHGMITNIGKAHLEGFGGLEGVKRAKGELFDYLADHHGVAFVNRSEPSLLELVNTRKIKGINFSEQSKNGGFVDFALEQHQEFIAVRVDYFDGVSYILNTQLQGVYNLPNVLNAVCIGVYFRVAKNKIKESIESYLPQNNRSQIVVKGSNKFLLDAYNANPSSMMLSIENFKKVEHANKIVILGDMYELGEYTDQEHKSIADLALKSGFDKVIFVGEYFPQNDFRDVEALKNWFLTQKYENTFFLIKGSRGVALEKMLQNNYH